MDCPVGYTCYTDNGHLSVKPVDDWTLAVVALAIVVVAVVIVFLVDAYVNSRK